jgi:hypothetical protein
MGGDRFFDAQFWSDGAITEPVSFAAEQTKKGIVA